MTTKAQKAEQAEALERLREWVQPGDTLFTVLRHVSSSGMSRIIQVVKMDIVQKCKGCGHSVGRKGYSDFHSEGCTVQGAETYSEVSPLWLGYNVAKALELKWNERYEGVTIGGCGMDMGFEMVYQLASALFGDGYKINQKWL